MVWFVCLFVLFYGVSNLFGSFIVELSHFGLVWFGLIFGITTIVGYLMQTHFIHINSSIWKNSVQHKYTVSISKTVLFQTIHISLSTQFISIWPIDRTLSGDTTPGQSRPGNDERVLRIPQSSSFVTNRLFSVISRTLVGGCPTPLHRCIQCILQP